MSRKTEMTPVSEIARLIIQIMSVPPLPNFRIEAIVATSGMDEPWAISQPIDLWQQGVGRHLLVAGMNLAEKDFHEMTLARLMNPPYNLQRTDSVYTQISAVNTPDQTDWIVEKASELKISNLLFMARPYHLPRAYLTLLKSWMKTGKDTIIMVPISLKVPPNTIVPGSGLSNRDMVAGEIERILQYQEKGDVATLEELENYLDSIAQHIY